MFDWIKSIFISKPKPVSKARLMVLNKRELEAIGRKHGIELDRRLHKDDLVEQLFSHIQKKNK